MTVLTTPPTKDFQTFLNMPLVNHLDDLEADIVIVGMPYGDPYTIDQVSYDQTRAPSAIRKASMRLLLGIDHYDFDLGGPVFDGKEIRMVDVGDVLGDPRDLDGHYRRAEEVIRKIVAVGAFPIIIGGDHGVPIPVFRALDSFAPVTLVQIDAHIDWRDEVNGVKCGYSNTFRRASEMAHVDRIFQLGLRGQGSARSQDVADARAYGAELVTAAEWKMKGTEAILARIPDGGSYYLSIDADGLDPSVMPAVNAPQPGGVDYQMTIDLIQGLATKGRLIGMDLVEITPSRDVNEISSITAGHIILNAVGRTVRAGYFGN